MDEFEAMVNSLGETLVSYIGKDHLRRLSIKIDEATYSADVEVCLASDQVDVVVAAVERIGEVRGLFMDELSFDYVLTSSDSCHVRQDERQRDRQRERQRELVFAQMGRVRPLSADHLARAAKHEEVGDALKDAVGNEWAAVCYFYSAYHLVRAALVADPIFDDMPLLKTKSQHLMPNDRFTTTHHGSRRVCPGFG